MKMLGTIIFSFFILILSSCNSGQSGNINDLGFNSGTKNNGDGSGGGITFGNDNISFDGVSSVSTQSSSQVRLFFDGATGGSGFLTYRVYLNNNFTSPYQSFPFGSYSFESTSGKTYVQVTGLSPSKSYTFTVRAMDALNGQEDTNSISVSATTLVAPPIFLGLESISDITTTSMRLHWTASANASRYDIFRIVGGSVIYHTTAMGDSASILIQNLSHSTLYTWRVRLVDSNNSPDSNTSDIIQATAAPLIFAGATSITNTTSNSLQVNWSHLTGSLMYRVYHSNNLNVPIQTVSASQNYAVITNLNPGDNYSLIVRAVDGYGAEDTNTITQSASTFSIEAIHNGWTNVYSVGPRENFQGQILEREDIRLSWKPFTVSEGLIIGYNVYYSDNPNTGFAKLNTLLIAPSGADQESFNVNVVTHALEAGKLYYFRVTIVVDGYEITPNPTTPVNHTIIRVLYPPKNTSLVHRWIVNQQICNDYGRGLGSLNGVNVAQHYRCPFNGLGHTDIGGDKFYDYGKDMVVDVNELGCNFSLNSCTAHSVGATPNVTDCVGNSPPNADMKAAKFSVYYFKDGGGGTNHTCFVQTSNDSQNPIWTRLNALNNVSEIGFSGQNLGNFLAANKINLPPLNWITQANAYHTCQTQTETLDLLNNLATFRKRPLRRKEYMGASLWSPDFSTNYIRDLSQESATIVNPCAYLDSTYPGIDNLDYNHAFWPNRSNPGNADLSRSATRGTGADSTKNCRSRFGIQDMVGNVSEWLVDHIQCGPNNIKCDMETTTPLFDSQFKNDWFNSSGNYFNIALNGSNFGVGTFTSLLNTNYANWVSYGYPGSSFEFINSAMGLYMHCYYGACTGTDDLRLSHRVSGATINNFMSPAGGLEDQIYLTYPSLNDTYYGMLAGGARGYKLYDRVIGRFMHEIRFNEGLANDWNYNSNVIGTRCGFPLSY